MPGASGCAPGTYDLAVQRQTMTTNRASVPPLVRYPPPPLRGGPRAFWRFARTHNMLLPGYIPLIARWLWLKLRWRGRFQTDGLCFVCPGVKFEIGANAVVTMGRWSWLGHGCKIRAHEGTVSIGAKSVLGQECTISCYQHISIGRECIIADRSMMIDFDHGSSRSSARSASRGFTSAMSTSATTSGSATAPACCAASRSATTASLGPNAVVTGDVPADVVVGGVPARLIRGATRLRRSNGASPQLPQAAAPARGSEAPA